MCARANVYMYVCMYIYILLPDICLHRWSISPCSPKADESFIFTSNRSKNNSILNHLSSTKIYNLVIFSLVANWRCALTDFCREKKTDQVINRWIIKSKCLTNVWKWSSLHGDVIDSPSRKINQFCSNKNEILSPFLSPRALQKVSKGLGLWFPEGLPTCSCSSIDWEGWGQHPWWWV